MGESHVIMTRALDCRTTMVDIIWVSQMNLGSIVDNSILLTLI